MLMAATRARVRGEALVAPARASRVRMDVVASARQGQHVAEVQRARLLSAAMVAVDELGYAHTTVSDITARAHVSRRTFYELFRDREDCLLAVLDSTVERVRGLFADAGLEGLSWRERVRGGLLAILGLFDSEPALGRVCVVHSAQAGPRILERREQIVGALTDTIDAGRGEGARGGDCPSLTAEGLVGATLSILHARLSRHEGAPLSALASDLMGMIVLPYLGPAVARQERARPTPRVTRPAQREADAARHDDDHAAPIGEDPLAGVTMRLTYRTVRVLETVAESPGASNRAVGSQAGIEDQGQTSKLLSRLERHGLLTNRSAGHVKGEPNAWTLTPTGQRVLDSIDTHIHREAAR